MAISGGSLYHSRMISNRIRAIGNPLKRRPSERLNSNFRIAFPRATYSHFTDGTIFCGSPEIDPRHPTGQSLNDPTSKPGGRRRARLKDGAPRRRRLKSF